MPERLTHRRFLKNVALAGGGVVLGAAGTEPDIHKIWRESTEFESNPSYWARSQPPHPPLTNNISVDVAVIGGGFTGLSAAYFIRTISPTKRVVVLEAKGCGNGASGRTGAMVLTMTADRYIQFSADPAAGKRIYDLTAHNIQSLLKLSAMAGIDCELETNGALQVLSTVDEVRDAQRYVQAARSVGIPVEFWNAQ
jgi:gamma-glutamylputrescine oxidase